LQKVVVEEDYIQPLLEHLEDLVVVVQNQQHHLVQEFNQLNQNQQLQQTMVIQVVLDLLRQAHMLLEEVVVPLLQVVLVKIVDLADLVVLDNHSQDSNIQSLD
jgi:hypothetical protein